MYKRLFKAIGARLHLANSVSAITKFLDEEKIDLVILDNFIEGFEDNIEKEKFTGVSLTKLIRKNEKWNHIPVVLTTGPGRLEMKDAQECGANTVLFKPFNSLTELPKTLEEIIRNHKI